MLRAVINTCLAVSALMLVGCEQSGKFVYRDYIEDLYLIMDVAEGKLTDNHLTWPLQNCDANYYCIQSAVFAFAVPKNFVGSPSWSLGNATYTLSGQRNVRFLGLETVAFLIKQQQGDKQNWFLYSKEKGLIGFGAYSTNGGATFFWLQGKCGFGGEQRC